MVPESNPDEWLYKRLLTVEDELVDTSNTDPKTMKTFLDYLLEIQRTAVRAVADNKLTIRTTTLLRNVASTGAAFAHLASGVQRARTNVERKRQEQLENAMNKLSLGNSVQDGASPNESTSGVEPNGASGQRNTVPMDADHSSLPPHVSLCYEWLLQNLHDPYPPSTFRSRVSKDTGVSQRTICDWFTNIRRKIGWTAISQRHFRRQRALTVDCARVVLLGEKSKTPVCKELHDAFSAMKDTAERLFADVSVPSDAAKHLDDLVTRHSSRPDQVDQDGSRGTSNAGHQQAKETKPRNSSKKVLGKRCATSDESVDSVAISKSDSGRRQVKRLRTSPSTDSTNAQDAALSPQLAASLDSKVLPSQAEMRRPSLKRRLSDDDGPRLSKRYRSLPDDDKDTSVFGTSAEVDTFGSVSAIPSDNTYDTTTDSLTPSPSTSLLTMSDESIGSPSPSPLEDTITTAYSNPDSSSLSDFFNFKDVFELPDIPTFTWNSTDILPPSFEPFPLSADFSVSHLEPNDDLGHCLPSLVDSDSSWLSSLESNLCLESGLDASVPKSADIQEPGSDAVLFSDFFEEFFCSQDSHRSEQSRGKSDEL